MSNAKDLLGWSFNPSRFEMGAQAIGSPNIQRDIDFAIKNLQEVFSTNESLSIDAPPDAWKIYQQFMLMARENRLSERQQYFGTPRQAKKLAYILGYRESNKSPIVRTQFLSIALEIIEQYWKDRMLVPLVYNLLNHWNSPEIGPMRQLIAHKLNSLSTKRKSLLKLKEISWYFADVNSPAKLGAYLITNQFKLQDIWQQLSFEENMVDAPYFSDVCVSYTYTLLRQQNFWQYIPDVIDFVKQHNNIATSKRVLMVLILKLEKEPDALIQEQVQKAAFELIGDPENDAYWTPWSDATEKEISLLKQAQETLNRWIIQQFILLFFEKLAMDSDRKNYWSKYIKKISRFKIYGTESTKRIFLNDSRLAPYVEKRFGQLAGNQNAIIMFIKGFALIEFSHKGSAFYAYPSDFYQAPDFRRKKLAINDLKPSAIRAGGMSLVSKSREYDYSYNRYHEVFHYNEYGKLTHSQRWQSTLDEWLRRKVGI